MKILIIKGLDKEDTLSMQVDQNLSKILDSPSTMVTHIDLAKHEIKSCIGCLNCFFKTPGQCILDDMVRQLPHTYLDSDMVVFITPITFGGFSSILAKAYYRMVIQLEMHLFQYSKGELNRKKRYKKQYPSIIAIGLEKEINQENRKIFLELIKSNAFRHIHAPWHKTLFFSENSSCKEIEDQFHYLKKDMGRIL